MTHEFFIEQYDRVGNCLPSIASTEQMVDGAGVFDPQRTCHSETVQHPTICVDT